MNAPWKPGTQGSRDVFSAFICDDAALDVLRPVVIKMGWTRQSTDRSKTGAAMLERASDAGSRPNVLFPVTSGNPLGAPT